MDQVLDLDFEKVEFQQYVDQSQLEDWVKSVLKHLKIKKGGVSLLIVSPEYIQKLNHQYLGKDYPTDVLSFSQIEGENIPDHGFLGDLVICLDIAREQAMNAGHSLLDELKYLVLHGILHLMGYDHDPAESGEMTQLEKAVYYKLSGEIIE
ncbi:MAG: rRNA maturation RNase YbeY [Spirochaetes bacterium]|nr:rRNA maturation RNase YbeY [Spirochaetota bacterium]